jgi:hypothetical protein
MDVFVVRGLNFPWSIYSQFLAEYNERYNLLMLLSIASLGTYLLKCLR